MCSTINGYLLVSTIMAICDDKDSSNGHIGAQALSGPEIIFCFKYTIQ